MPRKPAVDIMPDGRVYFIDDRNARWRVHDVAFGAPLAAPFKRRRLPLSDARATDRHFVGEDRQQRVYPLRAR